jgi:hypothetical protein
VATATLSVLPAPAITLSAGGPTFFCPGGSVTLNATPGFTYQWFDGGTLISSATGASYVASTTGSFAVTATNAAGCSTTPPPIFVSAGAAATIIPSGAVSFCQGGSTTLTASTGSAAGTVTYQWQRAGVNIPGATLVTFDADTPGIYTCLVTLTSGSVSCAGVTPAVTVTVAPLPIPVIHRSGDAYVCDDHSYTAYQWYVSTIPIPGATTWSVVPVFSGSYRLRVTNATGCIGYSSSLANGVIDIITGTGTIAAGDIIIYPNPAKDMLYVSAPVNVHAQITGIAGNVLIDAPVSAQHSTISLSDLPPGLYLITLYSEAGQRIITEKIVKE